MSGFIPDETETPRMPTAPLHRLPALACDAHAHVFGPYAQFPLAEASSYPPPLAPADLYAQMLDSVGSARGVLVQPAPYGTDAGPILGAIAASRGQVRGVAAAQAGTPAAELQRLYDGGIRGLRFVEMRTPTGEKFKGSVGVDELLQLAPAMKQAGLHAQLWAPCDAYPSLLPRLRPTGLTLVLDHMACLKVERGVDDPAFQAVLKALAAGDVWIKLSVCRVSNAAPDYADLEPFHDALVAANPTRLLWGSDWPYVRMGERAPDVGRLIDLFHDWVPDAAVRQQILVDNPQALYGFDNG
ncbi:amidohydrolase family protein [Herbaspirillum sp. alder98]|uniref:amidohydrolase family protein n=1 Tax=Herbaspirillum sp. alder98 TaxID=2913096 RepID=UPI001CD9120D|nr:amidohydrolase family protein [Herbaspirillum sp. alder98]MCA1325089.1 amidohydrolase family protein [Herbaspirillum sp. alder98]